MIRLLDDFFASSNAIFAKMVTLQIYTYSWPFRSSIPSEASRALSIRKTTYRETTSCVLSHFSNSNIAVIIPWSRSFLEKLTVVQQVKKYPTFIQNYDSLLYSQCSKSVPIPKSKTDGTAHFSGFPISLKLVANNKTPLFHSCILVSLRNLQIAIGTSPFPLQHRLLKIYFY